MQYSETELLDVGAIDLLNGMTTKFVKSVPDNYLSADLKAQALEIDFHWVNETGKTAKLTSGLSVQPTVSNVLP